MTKKIKWRLGKLPDALEVSQLVKEGLLTKDEGREILFSQVDEEKDREADDYKSEIKFLRELVQKLSEGRTSTIVETIRYIEKPYYQWHWYKPYEVWCNTALNPTTNSAAYHLTATSGDTVYTAATGGTTYSISDSDFTNIKTF